MTNRTLFSGCVTYWTLSSWTGLDRLRSGWEPLGLGEYVPEIRAPLACLRDALNEVCGSGQVLVRPLAKSGFTVVQEQRGAEGNLYGPLFSARIAEGQSFPEFSANREETPNILEAFQKYSGRLTSQQVSSALVKVLYHLGGTRLRPTGGVYWLSGNQSPMWTEVISAVSSAADEGKSVAHLLNHELDANAIVAVRDALVEEVQSETERIAREITDGDLGQRALEARRNEARALRRKVAEYEQILGIGLGVLRKGLDSIEQSGAIADLLLASGPGLLQQECCHASIA